MLGILPMQRYSTRYWFGLLTTQTANFLNPKVHHSILIITPDIIHLQGLHDNTYELPKGAPSTWTLPVMDSFSEQ